MIYSLKFLWESFKFLLPWVLIRNWILAHFYFYKTWTIVYIVELNEFAKILTMYLPYFFYFEEMKGGNIYSSILLLRLETRGPWIIVMNNYFVDDLENKNCSFSNDKIFILLKFMINNCIIKIWFYKNFFFFLIELEKFFIQKLRYFKLIIKKYI